MALLILFALNFVFCPLQILGLDFFGVWFGFHRPLLRMKNYTKYWARWLIFIACFSAYFYFISAFWISLFLLNYLKISLKIYLADFVILTNSRCKQCLISRVRQTDGVAEWFVCRNICPDNHSDSSGMLATTRFGNDQSPFRHFQVEGSSKRWPILHRVCV